MADYSYSEMNAYRDSPTPGQTDKAIVDAARGILCRRVVDFTKHFIPAPLDPLYEGVVGAACPSPRLPSPPAPGIPFTGGQCAGVRYRISGTYDVEHVGTDDSRGLTFVAQDRFGPISGIRIESGTPLVGGSNGIVLSHRDSSGNPIQTVVASAGGFPNYKIANLRNVTVVRQDGQPDNCGNLPARYPDTPVPTRPQLEVNVPIEVRPGVTVNVPIVPIIPIVKGELNVDVGGINVKFDLGGITVGGGGTGSLPSSVIDQLKRIEDAANDSADSAGKAEENTRRKRPPAADSELESNTSPPTKGGDIEVGENLRAVCLHLTKLPSKAQFGVGSPDCHFAGWCEFKSQGCLFPREQINFEDSLFIAPEGATGFAFTLTNGAEGTVTIYSKKSSE